MTFPSKFVYPKIESTCIKDTPSIRILEEHSDFESLEINKILDFIGYPKLSIQEKDATFLEKIKIYLNRLEQDLQIENKSEVDELIKKSKEISMYKEIEKECDILEISLANLKVEYDEIKLLKKTNLGDLEKEFTKLNTEFNDKQFELKHKDILDQAYAFLNQEPVSKNVLNVFFYIKNIRGFDLAVEKHALVQNISNKENGILGQIFYELNNQGYLNIEEMEQKYKMNKVLILKIVYGMTNNGIVTYDKEKGKIILRK
ncbi:hypothetical protein P3W45_000857 [Vairimorpha bombi]|jgi:hypothetical protein